MTFTGEFPYKVDAKGRVPIPPDHRGAFADGGFIAKGADACIAVYPKARFEALGAGLQTPDFPAPKTLELGRAFFSKAFILKLDGQSRTALPPLLRQYADIKDNAVVVGVGGHIEIWDPERWRAMDFKAAEALEAKFRGEAAPQEKE